MSEFNQLHPTHAHRDEGWKKEPNPFEPRKKNAGHGYSEKHIFVYADQLWYDIDATTNIVGRARRGQGTTAETTVPTSENDQERPMFYRWFDQYLNKAEGFMSAYLMKPKSIVKDNALKEWKEKEIWIRMPDYWDDTMYEELVRAIHNYVVTGALYEYFSLTLTSKDAITIDKLSQLDDAELEIRRTVNMTKPGGMVRMLKPFG